MKIFAAVAARATMGISGLRSRSMCSAGRSNHHSTNGVPGEPEFPAINIANEVTTHGSNLVQVFVGVAIVCAFTYKSITDSAKAVAEPDKQHMAEIGYGARLSEETIIQEHYFKYSENTDSRKEKAIAFENFRDEVVARFHDMIMKDVSTDTSALRSMQGPRAEFQHAFGDV